MINMRMPYERFYVEANENWLNLQKGKGLTFSQSRFRRADFEESGERLSFLIDPSGKHTESMLAKAGWKKKGPFGYGFSIYECSAKEPWVPAPLKAAGYGEKEIGDVMNEMRLAVQKQQSANLYLSAVPVFLFLLLFMYVLSLYFRQESMILLKDWLIVVVTGAFLLAVISLIHYFRREKAIKTWADHRLLLQTSDFYGKIKVRNEKAKWKEKDRFSLITLRIVICALALMLAAFLSSVLLHKEGSIEELKEPYVTLDMLETEPVSKKSFEAFDNSYETSRSLCVPAQRVIHLGGSEAGYDSVGLRIEEYGALSEGIARELLADRMEVQLGWNNIIQSETIETDEWDEAYYAGYQSLQYLFLRKGKNVTVVYYMGPEKLNEVTELFKDR